MLDYLRKDVQEWLNRSLEAYYPVLFIDCVHIKIHRKRSVDTEAFYVLLAVKEDKTREVIGIYNKPTEGVAYVLKTYADMARKVVPSLIPDRLSCHSIRHSKAMHLLQARVNLVYRRDILGHVSIQTTDIYARADSKAKREALKKAYVELNPEVKSDHAWERDKNLCE